jgi:hypothetical protein
VFSLSLRDVELLLAERGIIVSYETVRRWCRKFGQSFAHGLRRRLVPCPGQMMCSTQWKPMWLVVVSIVRGLRAAGR